MTRKENTKSSEAAIEAYKAEMDQLTLPQEMEALIAANTKAHATATEIFLKTAVNGHNNQEYSDSMNRKLKECFDSIVEKNERASEQTCMQILGDLYQAIGEKVSNGGFTHSGGHQAYKNEVERMEMEYASVPNQEKGPCGEASLILFKRDKIDPQLSSLLQTDEALTAELRRQEVLKKEVEDKEKKRKAAEEKNKDLAWQQEEMKKNFETSMQKQKEELVTQSKRGMEALEEKMKKDSEEKARLMKEGFNEIAAMMQEIIDASRKDMEQSQTRSDAQQVESQKNFETQLSLMQKNFDASRKEMQEMQKKSEAEKAEMQKKAEAEKAAAEKAAIEKAGLQAEVGQLKTAL